jgi:hypothetical protein
VDRTRLLNAALFLGVISVPAALAAQAGDLSQDSRFNIAIGFTLNGPADVNQPPKCAQLALPCNSPKTFPDLGLNVQAVFLATMHFAVAAELSSYNNQWDTVGLNHDLSNHVTALLVGPQFTTAQRALVWGRTTTRYRAFAQILGGPEASTVLPTRFAIQPGVGIDFKLPPAAWSIRAAYDYRVTQGSPRNLSGSRFLCALVFAGH